jgi:hypothetical protein
MVQHTSNTGAVVDGAASHTEVTIDTVNPLTSGTANAQAAVAAPTAAAASGKAGAAAAGAGFWTTKAILIAVGSVVGAGALIGGLAGGLTAKTDTSATTNGGTNTDSGEGDKLVGGDPDARVWGGIYNGPPFKNSWTVAAADNGQLFLASRATNILNHNSIQLFRRDISEQYLFRRLVDVYNVGDGEQELFVSGNGQCIVLGASRKLFVSKDAGANWLEKDLVEGDYVTSAAASEDCSTVLYGAYHSAAVYVSYDAVYVSYDAGVIFSPANIVDEDFNSIACDATCNRIFVVTGGGVMYRSVDKGVTFSKVSGPSGDDDFEDYNPGWNAVCVSSDGMKVLAVSGGEGRLHDADHYAYVSTNGGDSWYKHPDEQLWLSCAVAADGSTMVMGNGMSLYWSKDDGRSWTMDQPAEGAYRHIACDGSCDQMFAVRDRVHLLETMEVA